MSPLELELEAVQATYEDEAAAHMDTLRLLGARSWQPIDTAPRDGTRILVANQHGCWMAEYLDRYQSGYRPPCPWSSKMLNHWHMPRFASCTPTHWMPLPFPPAPPVTRFDDGEKEGRGR
jgi:hypothetical protein